MSVSNASILSLESLKAIPFILKTSLQDKDLLLLPSVRVGNVTNVIWWYLPLTPTWPAVESTVRFLAIEGGEYLVFFPKMGTSSLSLTEKHSSTSLGESMVPRKIHHPNVANATNVPWVSFLFSLIKTSFYLPNDARS